MNPAPDLGGLDFSPLEVKQLWWFLDGSIMDLGTRHHLWRSWGLCPRHAWGYAVTEIEVRGGVPFSTAILYEDLAGRAARTVGRRLVPWARVRAQLEPSDSCFTCDFLASERGADDWVEMAARVNGRPRTTSLAAASEDEWRRRACPLCIEGEGPVCRAHLLAGAQAGEALEGQLVDLAARLRTLRRSLTVQHSSSVGAGERSSWIEALSWFGGWDYTTKLSAEARRV